MSTTENRPMGAEEAQFMKVARAGDAGSFALLTERFRRELHVHCYRMLASYEDAQDMTQETFLRAWARRESFQGRASLRSWLYRIATNACLDFLDKRHDRVPLPTENPEAGTEVLYLQPYPDSLLSREDPHETAAARETIELAFIVAVQHLPSRQRAVLILRDVLGWPAKSAADTLGLTLASANSALQRARVTMREHLPDGRLDWSARTRLELTADERALVAAYLEANDRADLDRFATILREDLRWSMPPQPGVWVGRDKAVKSWAEGGFGTPAFGDVRSLLTSANGQPAVAMYLRRPGDTAYRALAMDVLRISDGQIAEITTFDEGLFPAFGLPATLDD